MYPPSIVKFKMKLRRVINFSLCFKQHCIKEVLEQKFMYTDFNITTFHRMHSVGVRVIFIKLQLTKLACLINNFHYVAMTLVHPQ
jgi:hypothetical protein